MNCPTVDKLSQYVDHLLTDQEHVQFQAHIKSCTVCTHVVETFTEELRFIKETVQTPTLPDDFTALVLNQLKPYETQALRRKTVWKRVTLSAAGVVFAVGLGAAINPTFAQLIGGMFSTDHVDEGLRMATEAGLTERVNLEVMNNGITFKVEDIIADSSRVALSYQILNKDGKPQDTYFDLADSENKITASDENGEILDRLGTGWEEGSDYGFIEISLREYEAMENLIIRFELVELNGVKGNWNLEVPVDLQKNRQLTTTFPLHDMKSSHHGVTVDLKKLQIAPSSTEFLYETSFTTEEQVRIEKAKRKFEEEFGVGNVNALVGDYETAIAYHLEIEDKEAIDYQETYFEDKEVPYDSGRLQSTGYSLDQLGQVAHIDSFIPQKENPNLMFVLDGVYKTEPSDFSVSIRSKELKKHPVSFEYEGNFITIKKVKKHTDYSFHKSLKPIEKEKSIVIEMEGGREEFAADLKGWIIVDDKGNAYPTYPSGSILNKKDENGRYQTTIDLKIFDLKEVPEEFTLHAVSMTRYYKVEDKWKVPLYQIQGQDITTN